MYYKTSREFHSTHLNRAVNIDIYQSNQNNACPTAVLLINDGQDLEQMDLTSILDAFVKKHAGLNLFCVGVHASVYRKQEYGTARVKDYLGRGELSADYQQCIIQELIPYLNTTLAAGKQLRFGFLGFSLGGLSALDTVWNHPSQFEFAGVFSGALWWRDKDQHEADFDEQKHRIMHRLITEGTYQPHLRFFFEAGRLDEKADRNGNGIIDVIDDTLDLIALLKIKGYSDSDIEYLELPEGKHDLQTWEKTIPKFLDWAYGT